MYRKTNPDAVGIIFPTGRLGTGFPLEQLRRGVQYGASAICVDAGSTDSGPFYLGTGTQNPTEKSVERDLRTMLIAGQEAGIPVVVGTCGTSGTYRGVDLLAEMVERIAKEEGLRLKVARIYSDQDPEFLVGALADGRIRPLAPSGQTTADDLRSCEHIVGLMGHEPIVRALDEDADIVLCGRATDTAMVAAVALRAGMHPGATWHAAKTVECGGMCTTASKGVGGPTGPVYVEIDKTGFQVVPLNDIAACTPRSISAHMLYENADPYVLLEPGGVLDTSNATYTALTDTICRVEGSTFTPTHPHTVKLEGSRKAAYETFSFTGIADPAIIADIEGWAAYLTETVHEDVQDALGLTPDEYRIDVRLYGHNAILGANTDQSHQAAEVGVLLKVQASDQTTANHIAKVANPHMLHLPLREMNHMPSYAFVSSPAELQRGLAYEFVLNHVVTAESGTELFRTVLSEVSHD